METKNKALSEENARLRAEGAGLEEDRRKWKDRIKELDRLDELVGESTTKRQEIEKEIEELADKLKEARQADEKLKQLKQQVAEVKQTKESFEKGMEGLREEKSELEESLEKSRADLDEIKKKKTFAEDIFNKLQTGISFDFTGGTGGESGEKQLTRETFKSLFEPEFEPVHKRHGETETPDHRLVEFSTELEKNGYVFSERLIQAFHTSLKVQDVSCLTVMAGISGTGKSALPRLYADYMGMHFLLVPVEPRWDSPQDLFGFLNYMENRYEATPLGRALNQFNLRDEADNSPMQDGVLLVLLDEMNLARVEYYFSEFLSRLEARRDVDWKNNKEAYQKVSMEIFAGVKDLQGKEIKPVRLFAGNNVLFVGTMNEDESTQSLTDKVIDRSNAIHFGRPKSLGARPTGAITDRDDKMSYKAWKSSINTKLKNREVVDVVVEYLTELNKIFDRVGRPFGHRAFAATCAYIANHPKGLTSEISGLMSLADQIAMRFLPRLRGLDLNEHGEEFDEIRNQLAELDDEAINQAFEDAADRGKGYFRWRGIDWEL